MVANGKDIATTTTDGTGKFQFSIDHAGRYSVRAEAKTFAASSSAELFAGPVHNVDITLTLSSWPPRGYPRRKPRWGSPSA
jgi:hypothetical protein